MRVRRPRRWSQLSRVERVDVYTRQSLYLVLWGMCLSLLFSVPAQAEGNVALVVGGVLVTALGTSTMSAVIGIYPHFRPFPWLLAGALVVACVVYLGAVGLPGGAAVQGAAVVLVVVNLAAGLGGLPDHRVTAALILGCGAITAVTGGSIFNLVIGAGLSALVVFSVRASLWLYGIVAELDASRHTQARLAVAEERLRFSRDVHDVLGRRLSTIAVQAELAATLAGRGDERAAGQMLEVRQVAHDALAEARELARGYRATNLAQELDGARSLLRSAGIEVELDTDVVPRAWHEAAGWVVRESVTNLLRHSSAARVRICFREGELLIENDGLRAQDETGSGSGLRGLRERLEPLGAGVDAGRQGERWVVVARLPGTGPLGGRPDDVGPSPRPSLSDTGDAARRSP